MSDIRLLNTILVIKEDPKLRATFTGLLEIGSYIQQDQVYWFSKKIESLNPPQEVLELLKLLGNDKFANFLYSVLKKHS